MKVSNKYNRLTVNQRVLGSSPRGGAEKKDLQKCKSFLFLISWHCINKIFRPASSISID